MSVGSLYRTFLWEGVYYGLIAAILGCAAGYICTVFVQAAAQEELSLAPLPFLPMVQATALSITACLAAKMCIRDRFSLSRRRHCVWPGWDDNLFGGTDGGTEGGVGGVGVYPCLLYTSTDGRSGLAMMIEGRGRYWENPQEAPGMHYRIRIRDAGNYFEMCIRDRFYTASDGTVSGGQTCSGDWSRVSWSYVGG